METAADPGMTPVTSAEIESTGGGANWFYYATPTPERGTSASAAAALSAILKQHAASNPGHRLYVALDPSAAASLATSAPAS